MLFSTYFYKEGLTGFIVKSDHFSTVNDNVKNHKTYSDIITIGILDLDILKKTINSRDQNQIFDLLTILTCHNQNLIF